MATPKWGRSKAYSEAVAREAGLLRVLRSRLGCVLPGEAGAGLESEEEASVDGGRC